MNPISGYSDMQLPAFVQKNSVLVGILCLAAVAMGLGYLILSAALFLTVLASLFIVVTGLVRPEYTFYIMMFVIVEEMVQLFITYNPVYEVRIYPYVALLLATTLGFAASKVVRRFDLVSTPVDLPLMLILCHEAVSLLWAPHFISGLWLTILLFSNYLLFFIIKNFIRNEVALRRTVRTLIMAGVVAAISITLSQWITLEKTIYMTPSSGFKFAFEEQVSRPAGLAGVDHVAGFVSIALFLTLGTMVAEKQTRKKIFYLVLILIMLVGIVLTTSRGVLIGLIGAYVFFIMMHSHFKGKFIRFMFIFSIIVLFVVLVAKPGFIDRMLIGFGYTGDLLFSDKAFTGTEADTASGQGLSGMEIRWIWWKNALDEMRRHPLKLIFGQGIGGFYYYSAGGTTVTSPEANGIVFAFFYDMGVFGCMLFLLLIYLIAANSIRRLRKAEKNYVYYIALGAMAALIAETGIHGLIDYDLTSYGSKYFWFPLAFAMAALSLVKHQDDEVAGATGRPGAGRSLSS